MTTVTEGQFLVEIVRNALAQGKPAFVVLANGKDYSPTAIEITPDGLVQMTLNTGARIFFSPSSILTAVSHA
jgi:hypothetical protein